MNKIKSLKESAKEYESKKTRNVSDLDKVDVSLPFDTFKGTNSKGEDYEYDFVVVNDEKYRVPKTVQEQLKVLLGEKPNITHIKVKRTGTTREDTVYLVMQV